MPVTTAAITALTQWNETAPLHEKLKVSEVCNASCSDQGCCREALVERDFLFTVIAFPAL